MFGGNPEFARREVEVCSEESLTLLRVSFDKPFDKPFDKLRDRSATVTLLRPSKEK